MASDASHDQASRRAELIATGVRPSQGFSVRLQGASIMDLVQLQCLAGARLTARITSGKHVGFLYFEAGNIVHAEFNHLTGERAALAVLALDAGNFEAVDRPLRGRPTIAANWQHLLLSAAQRRDEQGRDQDDYVSSGSEAPPSAVERRATVVPLDVAGNQGGAERHAPTLLPGLVMQQVPTRAFADDNGQVLPYLEVDADGNVVSVSGLDEDLSAVVAYTARLAELIGEGLGLDGFQAMECDYKSWRLLVFTRHDLVTAVLANATTPLTTLCRELGL